MVALEEDNMSCFARFVVLVTDGISEKPCESLRLSHQGIGRVECMRAIAAKQIAKYSIMFEALRGGASHVLWLDLPVASHGGPWEDLRLESVSEQAALGLCHHLNSALASGR